MVIDWRTLPGGKDFSHWQGAIDWAKEADQAPAFVILKATEGMGVDPMFDRNRKGATDHKIRWLPYAFVRPGDGAREIQHFLQVVGEISIPVALDWEAAGVSSAVLESWIGACLAYSSRAPLAYYGLNPPDKVTPLIARCPRWYPQYPGSDTAPPRLPPWDGRLPADWSKQWLIWQWSDKGADPAVAGPVDLNRLACPVRVFNAWYDSGILGTLAQEPPAPVGSNIDGTIAAFTGAARDLQTGLQTLGHYKGAIDGDWGPASRAALAAYRREI